LWVNLDEWFLLGPLVVALYLLGQWLQRVFGPKLADQPQSLGFLSLILVAGIGACLLNPYHVHAFVLPPELAYLVVSTINGAGPPNEVIASGRPLKTLHDFSPQSTLFLSPLSRTYITNQALGLNVAGIAFYVLAVAGAASFALRPFDVRWSWLLVWL